MAHRLDLYLVLPASMPRAEREAIYDRASDVLHPLMTPQGGNLTVIVVAPDRPEDPEPWKTTPFLLPEGTFYGGTHSWASPEDLAPRRTKKAEPAERPARAPVKPPDLLTCMSGHDGRHLVTALSKGIVKCFHCGRAWTGADAARVWNSSPHDGPDGVQ